MAQTITHYNKTTKAVSKQAVDDGAGALGKDGSIDYATGLAGLQVQRDATEVRYADKKWDKTSSATDTFSGSITFKYIEDTAAQTAHTEQVPMPSIRFYLTPAESDTIIPNTLVFEWGSARYQDFDGTILRNVTPGTNVGIDAGTINYQTGEVVLTDWESVTGEIVILSLLTTLGQWSAEDVSFRTPGAPIRPGGINVRATALDGEFLSAVANTGGQIASAGINGTVNQETGTAQLTFAKPVDPSSIKYNVVLYSVLPLDADILGVDPVRLPPDGRVPIFSRGDVAVIHRTVKETIGSVSAGDTVVLSETRLTWVKLWDSSGQRVPEERYIADESDLDAGQIRFPASLNLSGYTAPFSAEWRVQDRLLVIDVEVNGLITLGGQLTHAYTPADSYISSCALIGDMQARVSLLFDQRNWTGEWSDQRIGDDTDASFNDTVYPIALSNRGAITEQWVLEFTSATAFRCFGRDVGQVGVGTTTEAFTPQNPETGVPYFAINPLAWGAGWSAGNVLRVDTVGAIEPFWVAKTTQQGATDSGDDEFALEQFGNANRDRT